MGPALLTVLGGLIGKAVDRVVPDADQAEQLKAQLTLAALQQDAGALQAAADIIRAEAQGESWLQRNWRPLLMLTVVAIIGNNYLVAPYVNALFGAGTAPVLDLPDRLWDLMTLGVGGYVVGRTAEKAVKSWKAS